MSKDDYRKAALFADQFEPDFQIPDLIGQTEILSEEHRYEKSTKIFVL
jgi:hypothetical protein